MSEKTYEMLWDCKYCDTKKLLGKSHRACPVCGAPQDPTTRYFPSDAEKVAVEDHVFVGADIVCPACREANSKNAKHCTNCGSPLDAAVAVGTQQERVVRDGKESPAMPAAPAPGRAGAAPKAKRGPRWVVLAAIFGLSLILGVVLIFTWKREALLEVTALEWKRSVEIERYDWVEREAFCDELPGGAQIVRRSRKERGSEQVPDGEDCQTRKVDRGDGTYAEQRECTPRYKSKPIMADHCTFKLMAWSKARAEEVRGTHAAPPRWPEVHLARAGQCQGCEREGARDEAFTVRLKLEDGSTDECQVPEPRWQGFKPGASIKGQTRALTGGIVCDSLMP